MAQNIKKSITERTIHEDRVSVIHMSTEFSPDLFEKYPYRYLLLSPTRKFCCIKVSIKFCPLEILALERDKKGVYNTVSP